MVDTAKGFAGLFGVGRLRSPREVSSSWSWLTLQFPERGFGNWRLHCDRGHRSDRPDLQLVVHVCTKGSDCTSGHSPPRSSILWSGPALPHTGLRTSTEW